MVHGNRKRPRARLAGSFVLLLVWGTLAHAVPMQNDPNGFEGIPWGSAFADSDRFVKVEESGRTQTYELKDTVPMLGNVAVSQLRFMTIDGRFVRSTVRYESRATHDGILAYLQQKFGPLDRTPGQIAQAAVKMFSWRGPDSEITLRYEKRTDQGIIFFESQVLRPKLFEGNSDAVY